MAKKVNMAVKGAFTVEDNKLFFKGIAPDGGKAVVEIKKIENDRRVDATLDDIKEMVSVSLAKSFAMREGQTWAKNKEKKAKYNAELERILSGESTLVFNEVGGLYQNGEFKGSALAQKTAIALPNGESGLFLSIKPVQNEIAGENATNIDFSIYEGKRPLGLRRAMKGQYDPKNIRMTARLNAHSTLEDIDELVEMNERFMKWKANEVKEAGKVPVLGNDINDDTQISPQVWFAASRNAIYAHFEGQEGFLKAYLKKGGFFSAKINGENVRLDSTNVDELWPEFTKSLGSQKRSLISTIVTAIEKNAGDYVELVDKLSGGDKDLHEKALVAKKYNDLARSVSPTYQKSIGKTLTVDQYLANVKLFADELKKDGGVNAVPVSVGFQMSTKDGMKKFPDLHEKTVRALVAKVASSQVKTIESIARRYMTDKPLRGNYIQKTKELIAKTLVMEPDKNGKMRLKDFKTNENGFSYFGDMEATLTGVHSRVVLPKEFEDENGEMRQGMTVKAFRLPKTGTGDVYVSLRPLPGGFASKIDMTTNRALGIPVAMKGPKVEMEGLQIGFGETPAPEKVENEDAKMVNTEEIAAEKSITEPEAVSEEAVEETHDEAAAVEAANEEVAEVAQDEIDIDTDDMMPMEILSELEKGDDAAEYNNAQSEEVPLHPNQGALL